LKANLKEKLESLEKKVLVGGENLLEKAEAQEQLLEKSAKELEERRAEELKLKQAIEEKEVINLDFYSGLDRETAGVSRHLLKSIIVHVQITIIRGFFFFFSYKVGASYLTWHLPWPIVPPRFPIRGMPSLNEVLLFNPNYGGLRLYSKTPLNFLQQIYMLNVIV